MMRRVFAVLLMVAGSGMTQTFRGGISGIVTDQSGAVLASAVVKAANQATGLTYATLSSSGGEFAFQDLPLGDYSIAVSQDGFESLKINDVRVSAGGGFQPPGQAGEARGVPRTEVSAARVSLATPPAAHP